MEKGEFPIDGTVQRIQYARQEQLRAKAAGDSALEMVWSEAIDRLLTSYMKEISNANT